MSSEAAAETLLPTDAPVDLPPGQRIRILGYLSVLLLLLGFGAPYLGLIDTPIAFFLKNKLHMHAAQVAQFRLISGLPLYFSFLFGFARDTWNPFGLRDRGYMMIFGALCAAIYVYFAFVPVTEWTLLAAVILATIAFLFAVSAQQGLSSVIGRQNVMSGQVSAVWNVVTSIPGLIAFALGGVLSDALEGRNAESAARTLFLIGAAMMAALALFAIWRPKVVYDNVQDEHKAAFHPWTDVKRLVKHWPIYPALAIWLLWNFAPGSQTPLQYYLQDTLHADDAAFGWFNAIFAGSFIPTFLLYGFLCRKVALRPLLWWGTIVAVPQMVPLAFIHSEQSALIAAVPIGLMGGVSSAAYIDLLIRSCPKGLEGTVLMMSTGLYYIASRPGDILGTWLYEKFGGFTICVIAITVVYALIVPTLLLVPKRLISTPDGVAPPEGGFDRD
ncbi:MAG TPA: MFS transporter [Caulobacteraceae bacterium]|jgi:hypothetical protein